MKLSKLTLEGNLDSQVIQTNSSSQLKISWLGLLNWFTSKRKKFLTWFHNRLLAWWRLVVYKVFERKQNGVHWKLVSVKPRTKRSYAFETASSANSDPEHNRQYFPVSVFITCKSHLIWYPLNKAFEYLVSDFNFLLYLPISFNKRCPWEIILSLLLVGKQNFWKSIY